MISTKLPQYFLNILGDMSSYLPICEEQWEGVRFFRSPNGKWILTIPNNKQQKKEKGFGDYGVILVQAMHYLGGIEGFVKGSDKKRNQNSLFVFPAQELPKELLPYWKLWP